MKSKYFSTVEIIFLSSMIGLDFAFGLIVKPILTASGIGEFIRIDLIVPTMMLLITRLVIDKFGTLIIYEFVWSILAVIAMPASFGLPGFLKIIPAVIYGFILDSFMELFKNHLYIRIFVACIIGGIINQFALMGVKLLYGMPWSEVVQLLLGINIATSLIVNIIAVHLTLLVWKGLEGSGWVRRIAGWRTS
ncbi:hypothetical protein AMJ80_03940 [bacterium SM23_31]|nr:MAG: hypothetical protein AMJ80_03940 [bacterium SM23_31]